MAGGDMVELRLGRHESTEVQARGTRLRRAVRVDKTERELA